MQWRTPSPIRGCPLLLEGRGVDNTSSFDSTPFNTRFAAEVKGFDPTDFVGRKEAHRMDRFTQFAVAASIQAAEASKLKIDSHNSGENGVVVGNSV